MPLTHLAQELLRPLCNAGSGIAGPLRNQHGVLEIGTKRRPATRDRRTIASNGRKATSATGCRPAVCSIFLKEWDQSAGTAGRRRACGEIRGATAEEVLPIACQPHPTAHRRRAVRNVPKNACYAWVPDGYFGPYRPEIFWIGARRKGR